MAEGIGGKTRFNGLDLAHALSEGARTAYGAVAKPVEGTILTVIRESAAARGRRGRARRRHREGAGRDSRRAPRSRSPGRRACSPILREAGVVDSGGQGLYRLFQGALLHLAGKRPVGRARERAQAAAEGRQRSSPTPTRASATRRCSCCSRTASGSLDVDAIRDHLESIGESVLVAGDARALKVHVHNERPDLVIGYGLTLGRSAGSASRTSTTRPGTFARRGPPSSPVRRREPAASASRGRPSRARAGRRPARSTCRSGVVAVASGDGLAAIFRDFGVAAVVQGGQSANPSTGELLEAIEGVARRARCSSCPTTRTSSSPPRQVACMTDRPVVVVPTRNAAEGFAALLALDPGLDAAANVGPMTEAGRAIQTSW